MVGSAKVEVKACRFAKIVAKRHEIKEHAGGAVPKARKGDSHDAKSV